MRRAGRWIFWTATLAAVTLALVSVRGQYDMAHATLIYMLVVLGGSAGGGRALGFTLACACFLLIDYYLQTPYDTLSVDKPLDWLVLVAFLVAATVATQLLGRANSEAEAARRRAGEVDRLAALGAETLSIGQAGDALAALAAVIRDTTGAEECQIYVAPRPDRPPRPAAAGGPANHAEAVGGGFELAAASGGWTAGSAFAPATAMSGGGAAGGAVELAAEATGGARAPGLGADEAALVAWVAERRRIATERLDGTPVRTSAAAGASAALDPELPPARALLLPLVVHDRAVGVLRLTGSGGLRLDPERRRFLDALSYYAALGVERVHLVAEAERTAALREANRLKDALLASVSHDLRTPLTTIKALAHDIAEGGDERAAVIEQQSDRLNQMVADLLDLSRLNAGSMLLRPELTAAEDLVGAAIQQLGGALAGREVRTELALQEPMPVGRFDFVHSLRILVNLLENAVKYTPRGSPIDISMRGDREMIAIAVADRGAGVAAGERERIFEPFYRPAGASPDGARLGGAGLGLAISRRLALAQGGTLTHHERTGGGSVFTLRLPAASWEAPEGAEGPPEESLPAHPPAAAGGSN